jgi:hypothetical protein
MAMTQASAHHDITFQWIDGKFYRIPLSRLSEFQLSDSDVHALTQELTGGGDVRGYAMRSMPMMVTPAGAGMGMGATPGTMKRMLMPMYYRGMPMMP